MLLPLCFLILNATQPSPFQFEVAEVPITKKEMSTLLEEVRSTGPSQVEGGDSATLCQCCWRLRASTPNALLADPLAASGELFAEKLGTTFMHTT